MMKEFFQGVSEAFGMDRQRPSEGRVPVPVLDILTAVDNRPSPRLAN